MTFMCRGEENRFQSQNASLHTPALLLASSVAVGMGLPLPVPQSPHKSDNNSTSELLRGLSKSII